MRLEGIAGIFASFALVLAAVPRSLSQPSPQDNRPRQRREEPAARAPQRTRSRQPAARDEHHAGDWLRRNRGVPLNEQETALQNDPQFRKLPPERQQQLRQRLQHFNSLPPAQQQRMLNRMETWEHLTPQQKQEGRQLFMQLKSLPADRRRTLQTVVEDLRQMPAGQRQQVLDSERFKNAFSPQERELLRGISKLPLAAAESGQSEAPEQ